MLVQSNFQTLMDLLFAETQTILSPVIICGPYDVSLQKPIIISFQHCASIKHGQWTLSIYGSETETNKPPEWQVSLSHKVS